MKETKNKLASYVDAVCPIIYINHFDFNAIDSLIKQVVVEKNNIHEYNDAFGYVDFEWKKPKNDHQKQDLASFLRFFAQAEETSTTKGTVFLLLKDVHFHLDNPEIIALLKFIALKTLSLQEKSFEIIIIIVASKLVIPCELEKLITVFDFPPLSENEITKIISKFSQKLEINMDEDLVKQLAKTSQGLSELEVNQFLYLAYQNGGIIDINDKQLIIEEKKKAIQKISSLEVLDCNESIDDIGGLEKLKSWLHNKAKVFKDLDKALEYGLKIPKGVMLVGMPGCGKSLVAKVVANLFEVPLIRLDINNLSGQKVENTFKQTVKMVEVISPCILWIDDIEKILVGFLNDRNGGINARLFNSFFTWLQEKENTIFVVATGNNISKLPLDFLCKGGFDEIFWLGFPNEEERKNIFKIHLVKRGKWHKNININTIVKHTENFSGAEIEAVVKETVENAFINDKNLINTDDLVATIKLTKTLYNSFESRVKLIEKYRQQGNFRSAT